MIITLSAVILFISSVQSTSAVWPKGQYCLPMPTNERCPFGWERGYRFHATEGNDTIGGDVPYSLALGKNLAWGFCCKTRVRYSRSSSWPRGSYCIFRKGGYCPRAFSEGSVHWDDRDRQNTNSARGSLPDGLYSKNTQIFFCCRDDGARTLRGFAQCSSLILMKFGGTCPVVDGYLGPHEGYMDWNTEDLFNNDRGIQAYPDGFSQFRSGIRLQFCSYTSSYSC